MPSPQAGTRRGSGHRRRTRPQGERLLGWIHAPDSSSVCVRRADNRAVTDLAPGSWCCPSELSQTHRTETYCLSGVGAGCATARCGKAALPLDSPASCSCGSSGHHITQALPPWSRGPSPLCQISLYPWLLRTLVIGLGPAWIAKDGPRSPHL